MTSPDSCSSTATQPSAIKASICNRSNSLTRFSSSLTLCALSTIANEIFSLFSHDVCISTVTTTTTTAHHNAGTHHSFPVFIEPSFSSARNFSHKLTPPQSLNYESHMNMGECFWVAQGNLSKTCGCSDLLHIH